MARSNGIDRVQMQNALKRLATNIQFSSVDDPVCSLTITSSIPNEGKTIISCGLAEAFASAGKRVLIVECDLRRRSVANQLKVYAKHGLYSVLSHQVPLDEAVVSTSVTGLSFLDAEPRLPNPVDLLQSRRFHALMEDLERAYDYVIYDTPPISAFVDGAVVGHLTDATLLVVRDNFTKRETVLSSVEQLKTAEANLIGTVLNFCEVEENEYYYSYYAKDGKRMKREDVEAARVQTAAPAAAPGVRPVPEGTVTAPRPSAAQRRISPQSTAEMLGLTHDPRIRAGEE